MNTLIDSSSLDSDLVLVDERYSLSAVSKNAYKVLLHMMGSDVGVLSSTGLTVSELKAIQHGYGSIEQLQRVCSDMYVQFIWAQSDKGIQCRIKTPNYIYRLTP